jgi:hypothetical protein
MTATFARLSAALLIALALGSPASAGNTPNRPFSGKGSGAIVDQQITPSGLVVTLRAKGTATHLGRFTRDEVLLLDPATMSFTGEVVFTAANGEQLEAKIAGGFIGPTTATGQYTFTGGTGRFVNATGHASFVVETSDGTNFALVFLGAVKLEQPEPVQ